jgi:hypothetical protein
MLDDQMLMAMIIAITFQLAPDAPSNGAATQEAAAPTSAMFVQSRGGASAGLGTASRSGIATPKSASSLTMVGTMRPMRPPQRWHGPVWVFKTTLPQDKQPHQPVVCPYANFAPDLTGVALYGCALRLTRFALQYCQQDR